MRELNAPPKIVLASVISNQLRVAALDGEVADRDRRLDAVRPLHEVDVPAAQRRRRRKRRLRHVAARQPPNALSAAAKTASGLHVAHHQQERVVRAVVIAVERLRASRGRSTGWPASVCVDARVRMRAEQRAAELDVRRANCGDDFCCDSPCRYCCLRIVDLLLRERRVHRHVGEEIDQAAGELGQPARRDRRVVLRRPTPTASRPCRTPAGGSRLLDCVFVPSWTRSAVSAASPVRSGGSLA